MSLKNKNMSHPAAMARGTCSHLGIALVNPPMCVASVTMTPLKSNSPRNKFFKRFPDKVAGKISPSLMDGLYFLSYAGMAICPTITASTCSSSISALYTLPKLFSHSPQLKLLVPMTRCWSSSSTPSPGKCFAVTATCPFLIPWI